MTKLGRLVQQGKIKDIESIYLHAIPIKEYQIVDALLPSLKDEVMKVVPVQKQTSAGQRTRFKAFVVVGDNNGHVGLGVKCAKEVATSIRGAIICAKTKTVPVRRGYWGNKLGKPHTVPAKVTGKCGSVSLRLIPAPKGAGLVAAGTPKKVLQTVLYFGALSHLPRQKTKFPQNEWCVLSLAILYTLLTQRGFQHPLELENAQPQKLKTV